VKSRVYNGGGVGTPTSHAELYLSTDGDLDTSDDTLVSEKPVGVLATGTSEWVQWDFQMPDLGTGPYTVWPVFVVDSQDEVVESDENNTYQIGGSFTATDAPTVYYAECDDDAGFAAPVNSGWISGTEWTFTGLTPGQIYWYRVKAGRGPESSRYESEWSNIESSQQTVATCTLSVTSFYDVAVPPDGDHTYSHGAEVTCVVTGSPFMVIEPTRSSMVVCTGWVGTGSAPATGVTTNTGAFTITEDSSVTWLWAVSNLWLSNQVVSSTITEEAMDTITAGDGYTVDPTGDATLEAGRQIHLQPGFTAQSGSVFRAVIEP